MATISFPFTAETMTELKTSVEKAKKEALMAQMALMFLILPFVLLLIIAAIEYELLFKLFEYLADGEGYWNANLMALTGFVMIIGYHLLAEKYENNIAIRFINGSTSLILIAYMLGILFIVASMILGDGIIDFGSGDATPVFNEETPVTPKTIDWLNTLIQQTLNFIGANAFALGVGGLAVLNLFIGHLLISRIKSSLKNNLSLIEKAKQLNAHYAVIREQHTRHNVLTSEFDALVYEDSEDEIIKVSIAEILETIYEGLAPHCEVVNAHEFQLSAPHPFKSTKDGEPNIERLEAFIKACQQINTKYINGVITHFNH